MDSDTRSAPFKRTSGTDRLAEEVITAERKIIRIGHYRNNRGEFLKISEVADNRYYNTVVIPFSAAEEFQSRLAKIVQSSAKS